MTADGTGLAHLRTLTADEWASLERAADRFVTAWKDGDRPAIADYLPADDRLRPTLLVELIHTDLELRLKAGEPARAEEYLAAFPELTGATLDLVAAEYGYRCRSEPGLTVEEYVRRFPDHADELLSRLLPPSTAVPGSGARPTRGFDAVPVVPGYEVLEVLGRGGMGVVYKARQLSLDRPVALKFLPAATATDPAWLDRFRREGRTASALNHPHICTIYDTGEAGGRPFLSMEWVEGRTLAQGPRPALAEAVRWITQAARALAAAHAAGIVHRDVKPENLMVRADGILKVLDFGLARQLTTASDPGGLVGTLLYMSPEQARCEVVGPESDVYSLGLVLYELIAGRHPAHDLQVPPSRLNPEVSPRLDGFILRMLAQEPALRPTAAEVAASLIAPEARPVRRPVAPGQRVGRGEQHAALLAAFDEAAAGHGLFVCVTGEPGLGKTALVEDFLSAVGEGHERCGVARGRCSERLAGAEAFLPFLEALDSLTRGSPVAGVLRQVAPTWHAHLRPADPTARDAGAASRERLKRELVAFLQEAARDRPLVLFLDDIHWADPSSVDLLAYLGSRTADLPVLVVLTYRPADLARTGHPFGPVKLELQGRGVLRELALPFLGRTDLDAYLALAFPGHRFPDEFAALVLSRTGGNALFLVDLLRYLREQGAVVVTDGGWDLARPVSAIQDDLPESIRGMIRREMDLLDAADRELLSAAGIQGMEFDSAVVAAVLGRGAADIEDRLDALDRVHAKVQLVREHEFPDGTLTLRYRFVHVLYQNALYAAVRPTRRAAWSAAAARALLAHNPQPVAVAAELAFLFEAARDPAPAIAYYLLAARNAVRVSAHPEAAALAGRGLALLPRLPDTPARAQQELDLLVSLGVSLVVTRGFAAPEVEETYARARALIRGPEDVVARFPVLYGLWNVYLLRGDLVRCMDLAADLFAAGLGHPDPVVALQAHNVLQQPLLHLGDFAAARRHQLEAFARYDAAAHHTLTAEYGEDPGVGCLVYAAVTLWCQGFPDQAAAAVRDARALAARLGYPFNVARALYFGAFTHLCARDVAATRDLAAALFDLSREQEVPLLIAGSTFMLGWCRTNEGDGPAGLAMMQRAAADWQATGAVSHRPYHLTLLAEALGRAGRAADGILLVRVALAMAEATGERFLEAEIHRVHGDLLVTADAEAARERYRRAIEVARRQGARSLELRATMGWVRLDRGESADARRALRELYDGFTEGFDTPDLVEARGLLTASYQDT